MLSESALDWIGSTPIANWIVFFFETNAPVTEAIF